VYSLGKTNNITIAARTTFFWMKDSKRLFQTVRDDGHYPQGRAVLIEQKECNPFKAPAERATANAVARALHKIEES
jgi:hypothetical protein